MEGFFKEGKLNGKWIKWFEDGKKWEEGYYLNGNEVGQMMKVVGEEGTSIEDFIIYLKSEYIDNTYLQQNAFDDIDSNNSISRQRFVFSMLLELMRSKLSFKEKTEARTFFQRISQQSRDMNACVYETEEFNKCVEQWKTLLAEGINNAK